MKLVLGYTKSIPTIKRCSFKKIKCMLIEESQLNINNFSLCYISFIEDSPSALVVYVFNSILPYIITTQPRSFDPLLTRAPEIIVDETRGGYMTQAGPISFSGEI